MLHCISLAIVHFFIHKAIGSTSPTTTCGNDPDDERLTYFKKLRVAEGHQHRRKQLTGDNAANEAEDLDEMLNWVREFNSPEEQKDILKLD